MNVLQIGVAGNGENSDESKASALLDDLTAERMTDSESEYSPYCDGSHWCVTFDGEMSVTVL